MTAAEQNIYLPPKLVFRPDEVASWLRVSLTTVYRALRSGEIIGGKVLNQWRIPRRELLAKLELVDDIGLYGDEE